MNAKLSINVGRFQQLKSENIFEEKIDLKQILEIKFQKKILIPSFGELEFEVIWINSKINYYMIMINHYEQQFFEEEISISTLDQSLSYIEGRFKL